MPKKSFFNIAAALFAVTLVIRILSVIFIIDPQTGLASKGAEIYNILLCIICLAGLTGAVLFISKVPSKEKSISGTPFLVTVCFLLGTLTVADGIILNCASAYAGWQVMLVRVFGVLGGIFYIFYAASIMFGTKLPQYFFAVPLLCQIVNLIRFFALTTSITVIAENVFALLYYSSAVMFTLQFAKIANDIDGSKPLKPMRLFGCLTFFSAIISVCPKFISALFIKNWVIRESILSTAVSLMFGLFAFLITFNVFDKTKKSVNNNLEN